MRLIDADTCPELFSEEYRKTRQLIEQGEEHLDNLAEGFTEAHDVIQRMTTIDAAPVRNGRWKLSGPLLECNRCGEIFSQLGGNAGKSWNYCPNCGAKMDGE